MLKLILNLVFAVLSIGGGWYLLARYHSLAGATGMFYLVTIAVIVFVLVGFMLINIYVPSAEPSTGSAGASFGA